MRFYGNNWKNSKTFIVIIATILGWMNPALADPQFNPITGLRENLRNQARQNLQPSGYINHKKPSDEIEQINLVSEFQDVQPTDWAYEALWSLVERYGCIVGYPDRTYRGNRALTRWEFAAGLNACLNSIERLLQENVRPTTDCNSMITFRSHLAFG